MKLSEISSNVETKKKIERKEKIDDSNNELKMKLNEVSKV